MRGVPRFNHLRDLIPNKEKLDKAAFLMSTMDYIKQLQVCARTCYTGNPYHMPTHLHGNLGCLADGRRRSLSIVSRLKQDVMGSCYALQR